MKPEIQKKSNSQDHRLLLYLEGDLPEKEIKSFEQELKNSPPMQQELQELSIVLENSNYQEELCLPDDRVDKITRTITKPADIYAVKRQIPVRSISLGLLAAAVLLVFFIKLFQPSQPAGLDWDATEFHMVSHEIELTSELLADGDWPNVFPREAVFQQTDDAFLDIRLDLFTLENLISDSLVTLNKERVEQ